MPCRGQIVLLDWFSPSHTALTGLSLTPKSRIFNVVYYYLHGKACTRRQKIDIFFHPDNELDKTQTRLEIAEKKFKEKSKALIEAKDEAAQLKKSIQAKEERLKKVNEQFNSQNGTLTNSSTR